MIIKASSALRREIIPPSRKSPNKETAKLLDQWFGQVRFV